jgi:hypothetical protein
MFPNALFVAGGAWLNGLAEGVASGEDEGDAMPWASFGFSGVTGAPNVPNMEVPGFETREPKALVVPNAGWVVLALNGELVEVVGENADFVGSILAPPNAEGVGGAPGLASVEADSGAAALRADVKLPDPPLAKALNPPLGAAGVDVVAAPNDAGLLANAPNPPLADGAGELAGVVEPKALGPNAGCPNADLPNDD